MVLLLVGGVRQVVGFRLRAGPTLLAPSPVGHLRVLLVSHPGVFFVLVLLGYYGFDNSYKLGDEGDLGEKSQLEERCSDHQEGDHDQSHSLHFSQNGQRDEDLQLFLQLLLLLSTAFFNCKKLYVSTIIYSYFVRSPCT